MYFVRPKCFRLTKHSFIPDLPVLKEVVSLEELEEPSMASEDFSFYQKQVPGIFFFLGLGDSPALHSKNFNFDEELLTKGADFFEKLADNYR